MNGPVQSSTIAIDNAHTEPQRALDCGPSSSSFAALWPLNQLSPKYYIINNTDNIGMWAED